MERRTLLKRVSAITIIGLAGCSSDGGTTPTPTDESTPTPSASPTRTATRTQTGEESPRATATTPTATPPPTETSLNPTEGTPTATSTVTATPTPSATATQSADQVVEVGPGGSFRFEPESFTIQTGDTVQWVWRAGGHNVKAVTTPSGASWEGTSGSNNTTYGPDYTYSQEFTVAGEYEYHCYPHRNFGMTGSFTVE